MYRFIIDQAYPSGQPNNPLTGGGYYNTSAFIAGPNIEKFQAEVMDNRTAGGASVALGTLVVEQMTAVNTGDANYIPSSVAAQQLPLFSYGILAALPAGLTDTGGGQTPKLTIVQKGLAAALCTTAANAIAPGTLLTADGKGNLTAYQPSSTAPTPTVTPIGTTGAVTVTYALAAISLDGVLGPLGTATATATSNATGTNANFNQISWTPAADAAGYVIVRTTASGYTPSTVGVIGQVGANVSTFNDTGLAIVPNTSATTIVQSLSAPSAPTVAQVSGATAGTTSYAYKVTAIGPNGVWSAESSASTTLTTGAATLSQTQGNKITWTNVTGAVAYAIDRTTATGYGLGFIGFTLANSGNGFVDYGQAATTMAAAGQNLASANNPNPTPRAGTCLAVSKGTLAASTSTATLVNVQVGGF